MSKSVIWQSRFFLLLIRYIHHGQANLLGPIIVEKVYMDIYRNAEPNLRVGQEDRVNRDGL
jgi:hypothetical protein